MPNVSEKKKKLLYLAKILLEKTDEEHTLTLPELLRELDDLGISAERKSIYDDIETLRSAGMKIATRKGKTFQYFVGERYFSFAEVRLLADMALSSQSISVKEQEALLGKLRILCSVYQAEELLRQVPAPAPVKNGEKITLEFAVSLLDTVQERFGAEISTEPAGKNRIKAVFRTEVGPQLFSWLFSQGTDVRLTAPKKLAEQYREKAKSIAKLYKN